MAVTAIPAQASGNMPPLDEIDTILTTYDTTYAWNYGSVKEGLRDLYEKAKRDQWNGTKQLAWDTQVDPEHASASLFQCREVAQCLSLNQGVECIIGFRHGQVVGWLIDDL